MKKTSIHFNKVLFNTNCTLFTNKIVVFIFTKIVVISLTMYPSVNKVRIFHQSTSKNTADMVGYQTFLSPFSPGFANFSETSEKHALKICTNLGRCCIQSSTQQSSSVSINLCE